MQYIRVNGGAKIAVQHYNSSGRQPVLLLHGWPLNQDIIEYQLEALLNKGHQVVTMDFRDSAVGRHLRRLLLYQLAGDL